MFIIFLLSSVLFFIFFVMVIFKPPSTVARFIEAFDRRNYEQAALYLFTSHNRDVYKKINLEKEKTNDDGEFIQLDFKEMWAELSEEDSEYNEPDPRKDILGNMRMLRFIKNTYNLNIRKMYFRGCKKIDKGPDVLRCIYTNDIWYNRLGEFSVKYEVTFEYEPEADRLRLFWIERVR